jgi:stage V sporulation protein R
MLDEMANHAAKVSRIIDRRGQTEVERFIDLGLSIDNLIDPYAPHIKRKRAHTEADVEQAELERDAVQKMPAKGYMDRFINPPEFLAEQRKQKEAEFKKLKSFPEEPERDVVGFLLNHAPLERWQHEILSILREEAYYFAPQGQTKIMNEGWATYWHTTIMTRDVLTDAEVIDYADHHAGTVHQAPGSLNPYKLGLELWRNIEERWNKGRFGKDWLACEDPRERDRWDTKAGLGREKMYEVRRTHNDITFLDAFLTEDFCREQGFFTTKYDPKSRQWIVDSREFADVKQQLLQSLVSRGTPRVYVVDANHHNRGELRLVHAHEGLDVQMDWASTVLGNVAALWQRPVHLDTWLDGKPITLSHDGTDVKKTYRKEAE